MLAKDYEQQQIDDCKAFEEIQKSCLEAARKAHKQDLDTKKRLSRMMGDYPSQKDVYISKCGEELMTKRAKASRKGEEEGTHHEEEEHKAEQRRWCEDVLQKKRHGSSNNGRKKPMPLS